MNIDKVNVRTAITTLFLGWLLTITAFFLEPAGEVHDSVLWILGQSLTFSGSLLGAKSYIDYRTNHTHETTTH
jgi:hypothetical protein